MEKSHRAILPRLYEYQESEHRWEKRLQPLCGNQYGCDWSKFRPLRVAREEDWSDWLAWLLETSDTGCLGKLLFGQTTDAEKDFKSPSVHREKWAKDRRADIVVTWNTTQTTHIEVKIRDKNFDKTFETANKLRKTAPDRDWHDFILIPSELKGAWNEVAQAHGNEETVRVKVILWDDIVHGLRKCLWNNLECILWRAWAWTFCSAIERKILSLEPIDKKRKTLSPAEAYMTVRWLKILTPQIRQEYE